MDMNADIWKATRLIVLRRALRGLGKRIRAARERRGYSAGQVAHRARISRATLRRLEAGKPVRTDTLHSVLYVVGLPHHLDAVGVNDTEGEFIRQVIDERSPS